MTYRDLFEIVIMQSRKPSFFQDGSIPLYEIVTEDGLMRPVSGASPAARGDSLSPLASGSTAAPSESFSGPGASLDIPVAMQSRTAPGAPEAAGVSGQGEGVSEGKGLRRGRVFCGGSARIVEEYLGVRGDDILYVGDHIYSDNALAKVCVVGQLLI